MDKGKSKRQALRKYKKKLFFAPQISSTQSTGSQTSDGGVATNQNPQQTTQVTEDTTQTSTTPTQTEQTTSNNNTSQQTEGAKNASATNAIMAMYKSTNPFNENVAKNMAEDLIKLKMKKITDS